MEPRNRYHGIDSASLCSLAGRYDNPIPTRFLAPIDCLKIPALYLGLPLIQMPTKQKICTSKQGHWIAPSTVMFFNVVLEGLFHEIDFKNFDKNLQNLASRLVFEFLGDPMN
jgi:hypothetical protein